jgi:hypothetical protein
MGILIQPWHFFAIVVFIIIFAAKMHKRSEYAPALVCQVDIYLFQQRGCLEATAGCKGCCLFWVVPLPPQLARGTCKYFICAAERALCNIAQ